MLLFEKQATLELVLWLCFISDLEFQAADSLGNVY